MDITPTKRRALADLVGVDEQYLYQCLSGKGTGMRPSEAVRVERESGGELRRWQLRPLDWFQIWPELIGADGAPELNDAKAA